MKISGKMGEFMLLNSSSNPVLFTTHDGEIRVNLNRMTVLQLGQWREKHRKPIFEIPFTEEFRI